MKIKDTAEIYIRITKEKGLSDAEVSRRSGVATSTICNMKGGKIPRGDVIDEICEALDMTVAEFYRDTEEMVLSNEEVKIIINLRRLNKEQFNRLLGYMEGILRIPVLQ